MFIAYYKQVKLFISGYIKSEELAEELFVNLWENRQSIDISKSFHAYLHTIARNASLNWLQHKYVEEAYVARAGYSDCSFTLEEEL